ncbi:hypothetical protein CCYN49044_120008 [Capnocytophaga cynodegmi]|uniref:Uncharacterized protein n=1 Tax=Capnocytophaga cynodegmi TaxID=28189 RepID=A0A0B7HGU5_9FLAO|nr:hypothetical protein CCYN49044_120008 [Capnocytophaga cynodegmi]CEN38475.1 hypothetical protein CCYN74_30172 [Capnocytophaga cynodegmi]
MCFNADLVTAKVFSNKHWQELIEKAKKIIKINFFIRIFLF